MTPLHEQYRPTTFADVVGQDKALAKIRALEPRGLGGRAYWINGRTGLGKTTIGRILARMIADPFWIVEIDADAMTAAYLRELEHAMHLYGGGALGGRVWIVNEAHGLRAPIIRRLLVLIEALPDHVAIIFTTTNDGQEKLFDDYDDAGPLLQPIEAYEKLWKQHPTFRDALECIEGGAMLDD